MTSKMITNDRQISDRVIQLITGALQSDALVAPRFTFLKTGVIIFVIFYNTL